MKMMMMMMLTYLVRRLKRSVQLLKHVLQLLKLLERKKSVCLSLIYLLCCPVFDLVGQ
jgi:hypothetical protein